MITEAEIKKYEDWKFRSSAYQMALNIIMIDKETVAPSAGAPYRDKRTAFLAGEQFSIDTDPEIYALVKKISQDDDADTVLKKEAQLYAKNIESVLSIPKEEYVAYQELMNRSYDTWHTAKTKNDYSLFEPCLKEVIAAVKKNYEYRDSDLPLYDRMLDDFEPGMNMEKYDAFFEKVKERLIPLIQKVVKAEPVEDSFLYLFYPADIQKQYTEVCLLPYLGFTRDWGYQNETEHPFTDWTCENDCRTTTKYLEDNVISSIFSTIHETGHAWYMHDIDPAYDGSILSFGVSSGMHESQSRFCENYLGRSEAFWKYNYPQLQKYFPEQLWNVSLDSFVKAVNASKPSPVRTEADELTYPLHIVIRYEIEKALFTGKITTENLNRTWNDMYEKYLGIKIEDDRTGILQDVHWASGEFGYFPTYAIGSAFGAQFFHAMQKDIDIDAALSSGNYLTCMSWLKEHIHKYGARYDADEVMKLATGEAFNPDYYLDYLEEKYTRLYNL
ncbi:MAG: carboxypeptidase M32 [Bulleidia sp.]|nr:carboxypeptidase M32 [Bulleidia sp.]